MGPDVLLWVGIGLLLGGSTVMSALYAAGIIEIQTVANRTLSLIFALAVSFLGVWASLRLSDASQEER